VGEHTKDGNEFSASVFIYVKFSSCTSSGKSSIHRRKNMFPSANKGIINIDL